MSATFPYPTLQEAAPSGKYLASVLRKQQEPDRQAFGHAVWVCQGTLQNLMLGPNEVSTQNVVPLETEEQVIQALACIEDADDADPGSVKALGLIGDAGRRVLLKLLQKAAQDLLAGVNWDELIQKFLGGVLPTAP